MGTTRGLQQGRQLVDFAGFGDFNNCSSDRAGQYKNSPNFIIGIGDQLNVDSINEKVQIRNR